MDVNRSDYWFSESECSRRSGVGSPNHFCFRTGPKGCRYESVQLTQAQRYNHCLHVAESKLHASTQRRDAPSSPKCVRGCSLDYISRVALFAYIHLSPFESVCPSGVEDVSNRIDTSTMCRVLLDITVNRISYYHNSDLHVTKGGRRRLKLGQSCYFSQLKLTGNIRFDVNLYAVSWNRRVHLLACVRALK